jgi:hypothetical protein
MYQRAKMLAEKETDSCLQALQKVDDLIFKKTGEHMPQPALALAGGKRSLSAHHPDGMGNGAGPPKRQSLSVDVRDTVPGTPLARPPVSAAKTPKFVSAERQVLRASFLSTRLWDASVCPDQVGLDCFLDARPALTSL